MTPPQFSIVTRDASPWTVVVVTGEIDLATAPDLQAAIDDADGPVAIDLSGVEFMDSSGLRALITANVGVDSSGDENTEADGPVAGSHRMILVAPSRPVTRLLEVAGLQSVFEVHDAVPTDGDLVSDGS